VCLARPPLIISVPALKSIFFSGCLLKPESTLLQSVVLEFVTRGLKTFEDRTPTVMADFAVDCLVDFCTRPPFRLAGFYQRKLFEMLELLIKSIPSSAALFEERMCQLLMTKEGFASAGACIALVHRTSTMVTPSSSIRIPSLLWRQILLNALESMRVDLALLVFDLVSLPEDDGQLNELIVSASQAASPFVHHALVELLVRCNATFRIREIALGALDLNPLCDPSCLMTIVYVFCLFSCGL